jgi:D-alanyl-D-alanine carboxypeptidase/D-alanyl-D-alanine-endopeptidase (penicillin-binding protein 4)
MISIQFIRSIYASSPFFMFHRTLGFRNRWFTFFFFFLLVFFLHFPNGNNGIASKPSTISSLLGNRDGALLIDPQGKVVFSHNADQKRIPASTLKILTALVGFHYLGPDYRFATEFYLDDASNLKIKGYGDPLLISEILEKIADELSFYLSSHALSIHDMVLDDSYFTSPLTIPGVSSSSEPYDAPNGALCANFNTVYFTRNPKGGYLSAEPQTPLLPFVLPRIQASGLNSGRIVFSNNGKEATLYVGHLFRYFLDEKGIHSTGTIRTGRVDKTDKLIFSYTSQHTLSEIISMLMEYSNNFVANQIFITAGAKAYGPPGSITKGIRAATTYAKQTLKINDFTLAEGSGISRKNQISPYHMSHILTAFEPHHNLMRKNGRMFFKTGTLDGIQTRAGYIENKQGKLYCFVVFINTPGKPIQKIIDHFMEMTNH